MESLLFAPPIVFSIFIVIFLACSKDFSRYSQHGAKREHEMDAYACGQRNIRNYINPDYSQFFPYAFFFTIMHVLVLVIATAPYDAPLLPIVYILSGILAIVILFRR